jgi:hypothetical protein
MGVRDAALALSLVLGCTAPAGDPTPVVSEAPAPAPPAAPVAPADQPEERWLGRVAVPDAPVLVVALKLDPDIRDAATLAIPSQQLPPTALHDVTITAESMAFTLPVPGAGEGAQAKFTITRVAGADTATGTLEQQGVTMPVTMRRLADGETLADAMRPQTPKPPFAYAERQAEYESADGTTLAGTLTLPASTGKHPAIVLITGTGEQDRDETLADHRYFAVIADHFTRAGIAVLRVDDRGVGGSSGNTSETGFAGKVADVMAGMAWLVAQPEIDAARIGLLGHSEGGLLAPLVAVHADVPTPVAFVILLAAPGVPGVELMTTQMDQTLRAQKVSAERLAIGNAGQKAALDAVMAGADDDVLREIVTKQLDAIFALTPDAKPGFLQRLALIDNAMLQVASPAMRDVIRSQPAVALEKVTCPVLALGGTMDLQVPGETNVAAIRAALERGGNADVTTVVVPGRNHLFQPALLGTPEEWAGIEITIDPAVLETMSDWLRTKARMGQEPR